jgi:hypothetical protein
MVFVESISVIFRCLRLGRKCCSEILRMLMNICFLRKLKGQCRYSKIRGLDESCIRRHRLLTLIGEDGVLSAAAFLTPRPVSWG